MQMGPIPLCFSPVALLAEYFTFSLPFFVSAAPSIVSAAVLTSISDEVCQTDNSQVWRTVVCCVVLCCVVLCCVVLCCVVLCSVV